MGRTLEKPAPIVNITVGPTPIHHCGRHHGPTHHHDDNQVHDRTDNRVPEGNVAGPDNNGAAVHGTHGGTRSKSHSRHSNKGPEPYRPRSGNNRRPSNKARTRTQPDKAQ